MRGVCHILPATKEKLQTPGVGLPSSPSFVPVPVSKGQGLGVSGGNDKADRWGS